MTPLAYIIISPLLVLVSFLAVYRWWDKVGHLDAVFQEILCQNRTEL